MLTMTKKVKKYSGVKRILYAGMNSSNAIRHSLYHEVAFRQELLSAFLLVPLALYLDIEKTERILLIAAVLSVLIVELLNTAIETAVDRISYDYDELSGLAKDCGSAAVFVSLLLATYIWLDVLLW